MNRLDMAKGPKREQRTIPPMPVPPLPRVRKRTNSRADLVAVYWDHAYAIARAMLRDDEHAAALTTRVLTEMPYPPKLPDGMAVDAYLVAELGELMDLHHFTLRPIAAAPVDKFRFDGDAYKAAVLDLPAPERILHVLHYGCGWTAGETAALLGITVAEVQLYGFGALLRIYERIGREGPARPLGEHHGPDDDDEDEERNEIPL